MWQDYGLPDREYPRHSAPSPVRGEGFSEPKFLLKGYLRLLQTFAGLHQSIFLFFNKIEVRHLRYHFPKNVSKIQKCARVIDKKRFFNKS